MLHNYLRRTGFRHQLIVIVTIAILGLALFSSVMNSWEASRRVKGYLVEQGRQITENLARQSILAALFHSAENAREGVATTLAFPDVLHVQIADAERRILVSQGKAGIERKSDEQASFDVLLTSARLERE